MVRQCHFLCETLQIDCTSCLSGITCPPTINKLITEFDAHGRVKFNAFVKAFEEYFAQFTQPDPHPEIRPLVHGDEYKDEEEGKPRAS